MHNNNTIVPYISLCSGYEGIGLGLYRCIPNLRCIAYCEREAFAIANLVAKMEKGLLDEAPIFTDVTTFPWEQFAPYMAGGILSFGWPCQPVSMAGKRKATEDERWLFDIIADGISIMRPGMLFAENVEGLLSAKMPDGSSVFGHCVERLERLHYKVEAGIFSASEVGAPHQRKRVFILAYRKDIGLPSGINAESKIGAEWRQRLSIKRSGGDAGCGELANTLCNGSGESWLIRQRTDGSESVRDGKSWGAWPSRPGQPQHGWEPPRVIASEAMCDSQSRENNGRESRDMDEASGQRGCCDNAANYTSESETMGNATNRWRGESRDEISARQGHWTARPSRSDEQHSQAQPSLGRDANGTAGGMGYAELCVSCDNRTDELRLLGNGVVPATAERAFLTLLEKLK